MSTRIPKHDRRPLTPFELPRLLAPLHVFRRPAKRCRTERPHFPAILGFVYRNRFAVASQIQRRFCNSLRSPRTARRHLAELEALGYLGLAPGRGLGTVFPKVFFVTRQGVNRLQESLSERGKEWSLGRIDRRSRDANEGYAADHIIHELLITEFLLTVWQTVERRPDLELLTTQRRSLAKHPAFRVVVGGRDTRVVPDAMFLFRHQDQGMCCHLVEMDCGTMNARQLRMKFARYAAWAQSAAGQQYLVQLYAEAGAKEPKPTFRLLVVARSRTGLNDDGRLAELMAAAGRAPAGLRKPVWLTTVSALRDHQHDERPLDAAVWVRLGDAQVSAGAAPVEAQDTPSVRRSLFPPPPPEAL